MSQDILLLWLPDLEGMRDFPGRKNLGNLPYGDEAERGSQHNSVHSCGKALAMGEAFGSSLPSAYHHHNVSGIVCDSSFSWKTSRSLLRLVFFL